MYDLIRANTPLFNCTKLIPGVLIDNILQANPPSHSQRWLANNYMSFAEISKDDHNRRYPPIPLLGKQSISFSHYHLVADIYFLI